MKSMTNKLQFGAVTLLLWTGASYAQGGTLLERVADGIFDPDALPMIQYVDATVRIEAIRIDEFAGITIAQNSIAGVKQIALDAAGIKQIEEIKLLPDGKRAVIIGRADSSAFGVSIVDVKTASVLDSFLAYSPSLSPNGRYIAFLRFSPPHAGDQSQTGCYAVYDTSLNATQNRPLKQRMPTYAYEDLRDVGKQVFPLDQNPDPVVRCTTPESAEKDGHIMISESIAWDEESTSMSFVDRLDDALALIMIQLLPDGSQRVFGEDIAGGPEACEFSCTGARASIVSVTNDRIRLDLGSISSDAKRRVDIEVGHLSVLR